MIGGTDPITAFRLVSVVGARPQFVKAAALARAIGSIDPEGGSRIHHELVHTGQHYDWTMSEVFFEELRLPKPLAHLDVGSASHGAQTAEMLRRLELVLEQLQPDVVIIFGDTNSTLAGALAAAKLRVPIAHVESGLRSFRRDMPEEINRVVADHLSSILFCPSASSVANLRAEGIEQGVHLVGDIMLDALLAALPSEAEQRGIVAAMGLAPRGYVLATLHRAANTDDPGRLKRTIEGLDLICEAGLPVLLPMHPRTRERLTDASCPARVQVIEPVSYRRMLSLAANARVIVTDSGGLQKEALWLQVPCVTVRDETEWPETVDLGWNVLISAEPMKIRDAALAGASPFPPAPVYGTGRAADQMVNMLLEETRIADRAEARVG